MPNLVLVPDLCHLLDEQPPLVHGLHVLLAHVILRAYPLEHVHEVALHLVFPRCVPRHRCLYLLDDPHRDPFVHAQVQALELPAMLRHKFGKGTRRSILDQVVAKAQRLNSVMVVDGIKKGEAAVVLKVSDGVKIRDVFTSKRLEERSRWFRDKG